MGSVPAGQLVKTRRKDNRYDGLLAAAARLFREKGFEATSMRDIASACGMLPGSRCTKRASVRSSAMWTRRLAA